MRFLLPSVGGMAVVCALAVGPLHAQEDKGGMHRLVVYNGSSRTVAYYGGDEAQGRDRARRENDASIAELTQALRVQYLKNERALEARRHSVNMLLYGYSSTYSTGLYPAYGSYGWPGWGWGWGGWGGWGYGGGFATGYGTSTNSLQYSVGNEGVIKNELMLGIGAPAAAPKQ